MIFFTLKDLEQKSNIRPFGYKKDVLKHSRISDNNPNTYVLDDAGIQYIRNKYGEKTNIIWKIKSFFETIYNSIYGYFKNRKFFADKKLIKYRYDICLKCDFRNPNLDQCNICGCFCKPKTKLLASSCPKKFW